MPATTVPIIVGYAVQATTLSGRTKTFEFDRLEDAEAFAASRWPATVAPIAEFA